MSEIIACLSGLTGRIRKMKVADARNFSSRKLANTGYPIGRLLTACWEETIAPGPYQLTDSDIDWNKAHMGDRLQALIGIRVTTFGPSYAFSVNCNTPTPARKSNGSSTIGARPGRPP